MDIPGPTFRAGGTISPCRAVTLDVSNDNQVVQVSSANQFIIGIAQEGQRNPPGVLGSDATIAASQGDQVDVRTLGRVALVEIGSAVTRGDRLVTDSSGRLNTIAAGSPSTQYIAGIALESGSGSGVRIRMQVIPQEVWF